MATSVEMNAHSLQPHYLIRDYSLLIKLGKCLIFSGATNLSIMCLLVKNVITSSSTFINKVIRFGYIGYFLSTEVFPVCGFCG